MYTFITILIILACILLTLVVLVQNPKGGGMGAGFGMVGNQVMGARRASDFLEKSTWTLAIVLLSLSLLSAFFIPKERFQQAVEKSQVEDKINQTIPALPDVQNLGDENEPENP